MMRSMCAAVSVLRVITATRMDVIGNNIANVIYPSGIKKPGNFKDAFSQVLRKDPAKPQDCGRG